MTEYEIKPQHKFTFGFNELWTYHELIYYFTWRDIKVKYKQTVLGFLWAILQPIFMTVVFTFFLGNAISSQAKIDIPYPVFAFSGMLIWGLFSSGLSNASNSMVNNANIIKKIYFPRLIIPIAAILSSLVDFLITLILFLIVIAIYNVDIKWVNILFLPLAAVLATFASLGLGMFLAALNIKYRDVRYVLPFFIQGLLFLSPIMFPTTITSNKVASAILQWNPIAGALELVRSVFTDYQVNTTTILYSSVTAICIFAFGLYFFRKTESYFADLA
ncbi:MAG: ABC transporter permease [Crocinitomicaceae bacterium]